MNITPVEIPLPAEYILTGDHALIVAWAAMEEEPAAVLCLEDGRAVLARLREFKFDYRYDLNRQRFVDVSGVPMDDGTEGDDDDDGESDQEPPGDGSEEVSGLVPDADRTSEGDPS